MITAIFTSCGRFDFLERTMSSFIKYADLPLEKIIIIDNSTLLEAEEAIKKITELLDLSKSVVDIIINEENIGQVASIDKAYSLVKTDYIFHCEDDWEFFDGGFLSLSKGLLEERPSILNVNIRIRLDGEKGSMHPIGGQLVTKGGIEYHEYEIGYLGAWHGFSWNPGLRRKKEYDLIGSFKRYGEEAGVGTFYKNNEYVAACLEKSYCKHIGTHSNTPKSNQ